MNRQAVATELVKIAKTLIAFVSEGDICTVNMAVIRSQSAKRDFGTGNWVKVVRDTVRMGDGQVKVVEVIDDDAMVVAVGGGAIMGAVKVPVSALQPVKNASTRTADLLEKPAGFDAALAEFVAFCQGVVTHDQQTNYPNIPYETKLMTTEGGRFVRIVATSPSQRSAWAFIDKANGDILKAAGWGVPAKHARGNIFDKNSWRTIGAYGPAYMR